MRIIRFLLVLFVLVIPAASFAQMRVSIAIGPPALPIYDQPICPGDGYIWTPGYWGYDYDVSDYYWVPGTWVLAPEVGLLWTPGYWGWGPGGFLWYDGYWGPTIGFYGGINYGFGYFGVGFEGGRWDNGRFFYNRSVSNVDVSVIHNVYNTTVVNNNGNRVSYNGGNGGVVARPTPQEEAAARERHVPPVAAQTEHARTAQTNPAMRASANHGRPPITATSRPGDFRGQPAAAGREAEVPGKASAGTTPESRAIIHPKDLPAIQHPEPLNSGNSKAEKAYQKNQEKLIAKQEQERQKLETKQEAEHQKKMTDAQTQKLEQKHQQQTQQLMQRHTQEQESLHARAPQPRPH